MNLTDDLLRSLRETAEAATAKWGLQVRSWASEATVLSLVEEVERGRHEARHLREAHESASKLAWDLYCAAMSESLDSFEGLPGDALATVEGRVDALNTALLSAETERAALAAKAEAGKGLYEVLKKAMHNGSLHVLQPGTVPTLRSSAADALARWEAADADR